MPTCMTPTNSVITANYLKGVVRSLTTPDDTFGIVVNGQALTLEETKFACSILENIITKIGANWNNVTYEGPWPRRCKERQRVLAPFP